MSEIEEKEQNLTAKPPAKKSTITLQQAIEFGEYDPKHLEKLRDDKEKLYVEYSNKM